MRLLDLPQAQRFCQPASSIVSAVGMQPLRDFHEALPKNVMLLSEGTNHFNIHQVNILASVDQWLLFATAHYRRAIDMLVPASAPWTQVTLYYASFFAANAILGMFGGWVGQTRKRKQIIVDVEHGVPGTQQLRIYRKLPSPNGANGSHRVFWDFFYDAAASITAWAPTPLAGALTPVNSDFAWAITERNDVNYDMFSAWEAAKRFHGTFKPSKLASLRGPLQLQFEASERLIQLALHFATAVGLATNALAGCGHTGTAGQVRRKLAAQRPPQLVTQSAFGNF